MIGIRGVFLLYVYVFVKYIMFIYMYYMYVLCLCIICMYFGLYVNYYVYVLKGECI